MERLIIDILSIAESLMGALSLSQHRSRWLSRSYCVLGPDHIFSGNEGAPQGLAHPDHGHSRPEPDNFTGVEEGLEQIGFSSQC